MVKAILENPIFVKEQTLRLRRLREKWYRCAAEYAIMPSIILIPLVVGLIGFFSTQRGALTAASLDNLREAVTGTFYFSAYILILYVCYRSVTLTYGAFTLEKEKKTWESLAGTLLTPKELVTGKLFSALIPLLVEMACFSPLLFIFCFGTQMDFVSKNGMRSIGCDQIALLIVSLALFTLFFGLVGLLASLTSPSTLRANHKATSILVATLALTPFLDFITLFHGYIRHSYERPAFSVSSILNPLSVCSNIIRGGAPQMAELAPNYILASFVFFAGVSLLLFKAVVRRASITPAE